MDYESLKRLGLDHRNIDVSSSFETFDPTTNNHTIFLKLLNSQNYTCPYCGIVGEYKMRSSKILKIKYSSPLENNITIMFKRRQFKCDCCEHYFQEPNPFNVSKKHISLMKDYQILYALRDITKTYSSVAKEFDVSPTYVLDLFDRKVDLKRLSLPEVMCVDEVYSKKLSYHHYCFIIYDPINKNIIDVLNSRRLNKLDDYFAKIQLSEKRKVKYFSMDLYDNYRNLAKRCFPNAKICADAFHVIKHISEALQAVRRTIMSKYDNIKTENDGNYWILKKKWKLLTKDRTKLDYKKIRIPKTSHYMNEFEMIEYMIKIDPKLEKAYELYHNYLAFNSNATPQNAAEWLDELILEYKASNIDKFVPVWKMLENWKIEIINSFDRVNDKRISNGPMERVNRDIKTLFRISFGSTNFARMRNRIMYCINSDSSILYSRKTTNNNIKKRPRGKYNKNKK